MSTKTRTAPLPTEVADRLLDLLGSDDLFRERFQRDHLAALRSIGYESPAPGQMTACGAIPAAEAEPFEGCKVRQLASKETISAAREEILAMLLRGLDQTTPKLDTGNATGRYLRR
ncbi:NHLP-related RiPP peptide [Marilutibacter chinensis]|uniref:NHLP-related RiPP peptide n=1 Tax=Marilutibacter chinensis TaxID=2912247 RepID=A0ABS9HWT3_9GAMM|nr:NHLP-related RiPP peptide [Lysobacter chinensis]MCF7222822.1 NHLP-related RiPP peptide [Lysobacter chinensis]